MNSYSLRRSPEISASAKELANVNESQKSRAPAPPAEQTLDSFASTESLSHARPASATIWWGKVLAQHF
jgi:hypothetical protein